MSDSRQVRCVAGPTVVAMSNAYRLVPIDPVVADELRARGGRRYVADAMPGYPCRQCLRDAEIGESLVLVAYDPFMTDSPYRSSSPIFLHEQACPPYDDGATIPDQLTVRQLSVRAFDDEAMMIDAAVIDGTELDAVLRRFFDDDATTDVHVHNATRGCWATTVERAHDVAHTATQPEGVGSTSTSDPVESSGATAGDRGVRIAT